MSEINFTVCILNNGCQVLLDRTRKSLENQTVKTFEYRVLDFSDFWSEDRNSIQFGADYVMYLYSGSLLEKDAVEVILNAIRSTSAPWLYCDEETYDAAVNGDISGVYEKPDFGVIGFAGSVYAGEGVVFSKKILNGMKLRYDGSNFAVALQEMSIAAAMQADAMHIGQCLLQRHKRLVMNLDERNLLEDALIDFLRERNLNLCGDSKSSGLGLECYPLKSKNEKYTIILMGDPDPDAVTHINKQLGENAEVIVSDRSMPYWERCAQGAQKSSNEIVCVVDAGCVLPNREVMGQLVNYASVPHVGIISPLLYNGQSIIYTGVYSLAGKQFRLTKSQSQMQCVGTDLSDVRETAMPAWQFWVAKKELILQITENIACDPEIQKLPAEHMIMELAYQSRSMGKDNLYIGHVRVCCGQVGPEVPAEGFCNMFFRWKDKYILDPYCPVSIRQLMRASDLENVKAYFPEQMESFDPKRKKVFVITHELSLTGAPVVLTHAVRILKEEGWQVVVVSPTDGVLKKDFLRDSIPVLVVGDMDQNEDWLRLAAEFDLILVNTVVPFRQIERLRNFKVPVMWWLHDARSGYEDYLQHVLPDTLGDNIHVFSVSKYADDVVKYFRPKYKTNLLLYGLKDEAERVCVESRPIEGALGRKVFVSVGTVIHRKGQDILAKAVRLLPDNVRKQCLFLIIGKCIDADIFRYVKELEEDYPEEVQLISAVAHDDIFNLYKEAAAVICSSRDDPLPTFMAETMMVSGVCICSENTGTAGVIENGINGYVYKNDDPAELAQCIQNVVERGEWESLKQASRRTFEDVFSMDIFRKNLINCVESCVNHEEGDERNE